VQAQDISQQSMTSDDWNLLLAGAKCLTYVLTLLFFVANVCFVVGEEKFVIVFGFA
jgi:hypothetical protein